MNSTSQESVKLSASCQPPPERFANPVLKRARCRSSTWRRTWPQQTKRLRRASLTSRRSLQTSAHSSLALQSTSPALRPPSLHCLLTRVSRCPEDNVRLPPLLVCTALTRKQTLCTFGMYSLDECHEIARVVAGTEWRAADSVVLCLPARPARLQFPRGL